MADKSCTFHRKTFVDQTQSLGEIHDNGNSPAS